MGTCLSDEELVFDAVEKAVEAFNKTHIGAITGDAYLIDYHGNVIGEHKSEKFDCQILVGRLLPLLVVVFLLCKALGVAGYGLGG